MYVLNFSSDKIEMVQIKNGEMSEGYIKIDGEQIDALGLNHVRQAMCIIPQDSFVFSGTLRFNIDPFKLFTDQEIYETLERYGIFETLNLEIEEKQPEVVSCS